MVIANHKNELDELYDYKNQFMKDILTNTEIQKLLSDSDDVRENPREYMYTQVFPYEYIPDTVEHGQTFICCDVDIERVYNKTFLNPVIYIWVFTHKSKLKLEEGGVRTDKIVSIINQLLNGSRNYGLGELDLYSVRRFSPITDYKGKVMVFESKDYNRLSPTGKKIPANRKRV